MQEIFDETKQTIRQILHDLEAQKKGEETSLSSTPKKLTEFSMIRIPEVMSALNPS